MNSLGRRCLSFPVYRPSVSGTSSTKRLPRKLPSIGAWRGQSSSSSARDSIRSRVNPWIAWPTTVVVLAGAGIVAYETYQPFRHTVLAVVRCSRIGGMYDVLFVLSILLIIWNTSQRPRSLVPLIIRKLCLKLMKLRRRRNKPILSAIHVVHTEY